MQANTRRHHWKIFYKNFDLSTWEQKENFLEEVKELAMGFTVSYAWTSDRGMLTEVLGHNKYLMLARKVVCHLCAPSGTS